MKKLKIFILVSAITFFLVLIVKAFGNPPEDPPYGGGALQIQSNQLLITKPTKVTGTNTFIVEGGNVGIGTTAPESKLHVVGGVGGHIRIDSGDNNVLYIGHDSDVGDWIQFRPENALGLAFLKGPDAPAMVVTNEGNVGIGTTAPNNLIQVKDLINFNNTNFGTFLGYQAGKNILSDGFHNTALGYQALYTATSSDYNIAIGNYALYSNTTGYDNTAIGFGALYSNTTGSENTAIGRRALGSNTKGIGNVAIGVNAGFYGIANTTENFNTFIGYGSGLATAGITKATAIGYNARVGCSNCLVLGGTGADAVNVGIGTTEPTRKLEVIGDAGFFVAPGSGGLTITHSGSDVVVISKIHAGRMIPQNHKMKFQMPGEGTGHQITFGNPDTDSMVIDTTNGNVGIGITNPVGKLHVEGIGNVIFNTSGYVGIGTTTPVYKLDVNGSIRASQTSYIPMSCRAIPAENHQPQPSCDSSEWTLAAWCSGNCDEDDAKVTICCRRY